MSLGIPKASYIRGHIDVSPRVLASHSKYAFFFFRYACIHVHVDVYCVYVFVYMSLYVNICVFMGLCMCYGIIVERGGGRRDSVT